MTTRFYELALTRGVKLAQRRFFRPWECPACGRVLVALWTVESERSDMVLSVRVFEYCDGFRFDIGGIYVP